MRLLDLFCGAGGAAMGYHRAGFEVVGVDIKPQPHYPFEFHQADALEYCREHGAEFDAIHASPPCQAYSVTKSLHTNEHPELVDTVRELLAEIGKPFVIENVVGAPLNTVVGLCGSSFGLGVRRHRHFESNVVLFGAECRHDLQPEPIDVTGTGGPNSGHHGTGGAHRKPHNILEAQTAMGIEWMGRKEINLAIPPAYTEFIGKQLMQYLKVAA